MLFSVYLMVVSKDAGYMELSCGIVIECFWGACYSSCIDASILFIHFLIMKNTIVRSTK